MHVLDNGQVLIVGGLKNTSKGLVPNESTLIFDPVSQTNSSLEVNPLATELHEFGWALQSYLLGLANGKVLLIALRECVGQGIRYLILFLLI